MREIDGPLPEHLRGWWNQDLWCLHSADWWRWHWERNGIVEVAVANTMPDGWQVWLDWHKVIAPDNQEEIRALEVDRGSCLGYIRVLSRRQGSVPLADPIMSLPEQYTKKPVIRTDPEIEGAQRE